MDGSSSQAIGSPRDVTPPGSRRSRRAAGRPVSHPAAAPPWSTGVGWMIAAVLLIALTLVLFTAGRFGAGSP